MTALWLGHFVHQMAFHYGLGGWALLALIACALGLAALGVLLIALKTFAGVGALGKAFARGWREAGVKPPTDAP